MTKRTPRAPILKIDVTRDIIEASKPRDSGYCMIAEAVKAAFPDAAHVGVDIQTIRLSNPKKGLRYIYLTPRLAQIALIDFDQEETPVPFSVYLRNGQVTRMAPKKMSKSVQAALSDEEKKVRSDLAVEGRKAWKARLSTRAVGTVPDKIGGQPPPKAPLSRRRTFGLRALQQ